jgi:anti-sigma factor RsiW
VNGKDDKMNCEEAQELLEPYHDEELTAETRSAVAAHVKSCTPCTSALSQLGDLSTAVKAVGAFPVPDSLRRNVQKLIADSLRSVAPMRGFGFGTLAASHIAVAVVGGLATYGYLADRDLRAFNAREVVSAHVRSLMDNKLVQVTSSDTHTVRPWFAGKLDFAPDVRDFAGSGYPLVGARIDYVGGGKVAALVYMHDKHIINVFVSPAALPEFGALGEVSKNGYTIVEWRSRDLLYRAVSDLNAAELEGFVRALKAPPAS